MKTQLFLTSASEKYMDETSIQLIRDRITKLFIDIHEDHAGQFKDGVKCASLDEILFLRELLEKVKK